MQTPLHETAASAAPSLFNLLLQCRCAAAPAGTDAAQRNRAASQLHSRLLRDALRQGIPACDAEDVAQDALLQVLTVPLGGWTHPEAIVPTIGRRRILDRMRRLQRERSRLCPLADEGGIAE
jgi:DNA-directed RNA polymerase specialized sigma24 family protein